MEDCETPTLAQVIEFKYERTPTMVFEANRLQEAQNLIVNRINVRCFTPTMDNFQSPGLSPIAEMAKNFMNSVVVNVADNTGGFQKPMVPEKKHRYKSPTVVGQLQQQQQLQAQLQRQQQQQSQQQIYCSTSKPSPQSAQVLQAQQQQQQQQQQFQQPTLLEPLPTSDSPLLQSLNSTAKDEVSEYGSEETSPDCSHILSTSSSNNNNNSTSNLLDRTLNVVTLLRSVGLEQYADLFEEQDLDLEQFLNISYEDLQRIGVRTHEHRKIIMDLLSEFNNA